MANVLQLLGPPCLLRDDGQALAVRGQKAWGLLAYLVLRPGGASRSHLASLLFADAEDPLAALRWNLSELRRGLGETVLRGDPISLPRALLARSDVAVLAQGHWREGTALPSLGGELLEGLHFDGCPSFQVWLDGQRQHAAALTTGLLREAALARLAEGAAAEAVGLARRLVALEPLDENFQVLLVRCLAVAGDGIGAARQAAACRALIERELGTPPGPALEEALTTATATITRSPQGGRGAVLAQLDAGEAALRAGVLEAGLQCLRRAVADADAVGDAELRKRSRVALGGALVHAARGRDEEGAAALHEVLGIGPPDTPELDSAACRELGYVEFLRGRYERAMTWLSRAEPLAHGVAMERARIATVRGAVLSDQASYGQALVQLQQASDLSREAGERRQAMYADSMIGRVLLLTGDHDVGSAILDRTVHEARQSWTAFLPWPQSLAAELELQMGRVERASEQFEQAFALGCQIGDPCWEGLAGRGLARVAQHRGRPEQARELLLDAMARAARFPDSYLWGRVYALDALCELEILQAWPGARSHVDEMLALAQRSGMLELVARAHLHNAALGEAAARAVAAELAQDIDNPVLSRAVEAATRPHALTRP